MEEQTTDIEVTVKTLDSQSRTYTVGAQVNSPYFTLQSIQGILSPVCHSMTHLCVLPFP